MQLPDLLAPVRTERMDLPSGGEVGIAKTTPAFTLWTGPPPADTYFDNGKPVVCFNGEALFAELAILRALQADGWEGVWVDTFRNQHLDAMGQTADVPAEHLALLDRIYQRAGNRSGCFDVYAWKEDRVLFAEAKRAQQDRIRSSQLRWLNAALDVGVPLGSFLVVEWSVAELVWAEAPEEATVQCFDDSSDSEAHDRFVAWVTANPDAYVLNPSAARGPMIHRAKCTHLTLSDNNGSRMTASEKLCCTDRLTLERHWRSESGRDLVPCGSCM